MGGREVATGKMICTLHGNITKNPSLLNITHYNPTLELDGLSTIEDRDLRALHLTPPPPPKTI
jgi:hypothetical protein